MGKKNYICNHRAFVSNCRGCYKRREQAKAQPKSNRRILDRDYEEQRSKLLSHFMRYDPRDTVPEPVVLHPALVEEIMWAGGTMKWVSLQKDFLQLLEKRRNAPNNRQRRARKGR